MPNNDFLFGARLHVLRSEHNYTMKGFCEIFNQSQNKIRLNRSTVAKFEKGLQEPMASTVIALAEFFHVSLGYLLGITDNRNCKEITITNSTIIQGNTATTLIVRNSIQKIDTQEFEMSEEEAELFRIYESLNIRARATLLIAAYDIFDKQTEGKL